MSITTFLSNNSKIQVTANYMFDFFFDHLKSFNLLFRFRFIFIDIRLTNKYFPIIPAD